MAGVTSPVSRNETGLSAAEVGRDNSERNAHVFEPHVLQKLCHERNHAIAARKAEFGEAPSRHVAETHGGADCGNFVRGGPTGVGSGDNGSGAHSRNAMQRNIFPLQNPENAHVGDAAGESAAQRQTDAWSRARPGSRRRLGGRRTNISGCSFCCVAASLH